MNRIGDGSKASGGVDSLVDGIIVDAHGDDEQLWAFRQAIEDKGRFPSDAFVIKWRSGRRTD